MEGVESHGLAFKLLQNQDRLMSVYKESSSNSGEANAILTYHGHKAHFEEPEELSQCSSTKIRAMSI